MASGMCGSAELPWSLLRALDWMVAQQQWLSLGLGAVAGAAAWWGFRTLGELRGRLADLDLLKAATDHIVADSARPKHDNTD